MTNKHKHILAIVGSITAFTLFAISFYILSKENANENIAKVITFAGAMVSMVTARYQYRLAKRA